MEQKNLKEEIEIPDNIEVEIEKKTIKVKGPKGENERNFLEPRIILTKKDNKIILQTKTKTKREKTILGTFKAHINNLIKGVSETFIYKLKICSGHFPMTVTTENNNVVINNFLGEKIPRKAKIFSNVEVKVDGDIITVTSVDKEKAGQTAANIEAATKITSRDRRIFQDGCFIFMKDGKEIE